MARMRTRSQQEPKTPATPWTQDGLCLYELNYTSATSGRSLKPSTVRVRNFRNSVNHYSVRTLPVSCLLVCESEAKLLFSKDQLAQYGIDSATILRFDGIIPSIAHIW
jgi:hypothetical protein